MGVFPSDLEMRQIMYEFKEHTTAHFAEEGDAAAREAALSLSFEDLLRIYVNNRPVGDVLQVRLGVVGSRLVWVGEGGCCGLVVGVVGVDCAVVATAVVDRTVGSTASRYRRLSIAQTQLVIALEHLCRPPHARRWSWSRRSVRCSGG